MPIATASPATSMTTPAKAWWKEAVVYQIYPISFFDSNGDGFGDLNGIHAKLDYLKDLGVDVLSLSPIFRSPLADMGYDISNYQVIDPRYGTWADWNNLVKGVHDKGMKLILDIVLNHTSDEHPWFLSSRRSRSDPKRDWYIWRPPKYDASGRRHPPNNWKSTFQGPAWEYDDRTEEYYLHTHLSKQPDLNWENPQVREAAWELMKFWIDKGCDGFRMDDINLISKVEGLPDATVSVPGEEYQPATMNFTNGPRVHDYIQEMHAKVLSKKELMSVGHTPFTDSPSDLAGYVLPKDRLNLVLATELQDIDSPREGADVADLKTKAWSLDELRSIVTKWQTYGRDDGFWNTIFLEDHDHARSISRFGNDSDQWRALSAKMLATFQITQSGTQFIYQGQELAMKNLPRTWGIEEYKDVASLNYWNSVLAQRRHQIGKRDVEMGDILDDLQRKARDHARAPMQWDSSSNAGFTLWTPWMRVNDDHEKWNVDAQLGDEDSVLAYWKRAMKIRKEHEVLIYGDFRDVSASHPAVFAYVRTLNGSAALILLNFKEQEVDFELTEGLEWVQRDERSRCILGNYPGSEGNCVILGQAVRLRGYESRVYIRD